MRFLQSKPISDLIGHQIDYFLSPRNATGAGQAPRKSWYRSMIHTVSDTRSRFRRILVKTLAVAAVAMMVTAVPALALAPKLVAELAPHRAVYDITLDESSSGDGVIAVRGRMVFDFTGSRCDGFTLNIRLVTQLTNRAGEATTTDLRTSTWEQGEGQQFRFNTSQYQDDKLSEVASGKATRTTNDKGVTVALTKPAEETLRYQGQILFPTQHSLEILTAAEAGRRLVQARIFDGSEQGRKLYNTTAFIGNPSPPGANKRYKQQVPNGEVLDPLTSWPVTISYFDGTTEAEGTPAYELSFRLFANGVSRDIVINYGSFAIKGALSSLEFFQPSKCE